MKYLRINSLDDYGFGNNVLQIHVCVRRDTELIEPHWRIEAGRRNDETSRMEHQLCTPSKAKAELLARVGRRVTQKFKFLSKIADPT